MIRDNGKSISSDNGKIIQFFGSVRDITERMEAEMPLFECEERWRTLVEKVHCGVYIWQNSKFHIVNLKLADVTGYTCDELLQMDPGNLFLPDDNQFFHDISRKIGEGTESQSIFELHIITKDGVIKNFLFSTSSITYNGSYAVFTVVQDITKYKRYEKELLDKNKQLSLFSEDLTSVHMELILTEEKLTANKKKLAEREQFLNAIIQGSPIPTFVIDQDCNIISWNHALEVYSGLKAPDLLGNPYPWQAFYPSKRPCLADLIVKNYDEIPVRYQGKYSPSDLVKDGFEVIDFFPTMHDGKWLLFTAAPVRNEKGEIIGAIETIQDVTARKTAEEELNQKNEELGAANEELAVIAEELRVALEETKEYHINLQESEEKFRTLLEDLKVGVYRRATDDIGTITWVNKYLLNLMGYSSVEEFKKIPVIDQYIHPEQFHTITDEIHTIGYVRDREILLRKKDGTPVTIAITAHKKVDSIRNISYIDGIFEDITEKKCTQMMILQSNKKLNLLNEITRHDILNTLSALYLCLHLGKANITDERAIEWNNKANNCASVIQEQIEFTRDYHNLGIKSPIWQNVPNVIKRATVSFDLSSVALEIAVPDFEISADALFIKVIHNLIDNALKYGETLTTIRFSMDERPFEIVLICEDDGKGVPNDVKEGIFQRKFFKHSGYGLFLSREILEISNITIKETGIFGSGARFEIHVPKEVCRIRTDRDMFQYYSCKIS